MGLKKVKIDYKEKEKSIVINDKLKTQYWIVNVMLILTIINSILFPVLVLEKQQLQWFGYIWGIIGIASLVILIYQISRKSAAEKLKLTEIISLQEDQFFGRKRFSLKLKNGKYRDLLEVKNEVDIFEIKQFQK